MTDVIDLRREEFFCVQHHFRHGMRVLEIGGGNGYQSSLIAATGAEVHSIDVTAPPDAAQIFYPVRIYDGHTIPYPDHYFDIVFSSNVLEHIPHLEAILSEIKRVMKSDGLVIHILPTSSWRVWTSLSHYVYYTKRILTRVFSLIVTGRDRALSKPLSARSRTKPLRSVIKFVLLQGPHGEYPSAISEIWYFSCARWKKVFRNNGFDVVSAKSSGVFYTGYNVLPLLSVGVRKSLSRLLGSSTRIFVLRSKA